ncbi:MAG: FxsA family protein [Candidatus Nanohalobium sp.]
MLPFVDLYLLIQVADVLGFWKTLAAVMLTGLVGAELIRREGRHVFRKLQTSVTGGEVSRNFLEGAILVLSGLFLLSPGFITDTLGFLMVLRPIRERLVAHVMNKRGGNFQVEVQQI